MNSRPDAGVAAEGREGGKRGRPWQSIADPSVYAPVVAATAAVAFPWLVRSEYLRHVAIMVLLFAAVGGAWNLIGGYGGQLSLGHAAFFGLGAYSSTMLLNYLNVSPWLGMVVGAAVACVFALFLGWTCFRMRGPYFAIATIALGQVLRLLFLQQRDITHGARGLTVPYLGDAPLYFQFSGKVPYYYIALLLAFLATGAALWLERTRLGYQLRAIGQNEEAAEAVGVGSLGAKQRALAISAVLTSLAGTFYAQYMYYIDPDTVFGLGMSIEFALVAIVGGAGTAMGPALGAALLRPLVEVTQATLGATYAGVHLTVFGSILIVVIILRPTGVIGWAEIMYRRLLGALPAWRPSPARGRRPRP